MRDRKISLLSLGWRRGRHGRCLQIVHSEYVHPDNSRHLRAAVFAGHWRARWCENIVVHWKFLDQTNHVSFWLRSIDCSL